MCLSRFVVFTCYRSQCVCQFLSQLQVVFIVWAQRSRPRLPQPPTFPCDLHHCSEQLLSTGCVCIQKPHWCVSFGASEGAAVMFGKTRACPFINPGMSPPASSRGCRQSVVAATTLQCQRCCPSPTPVPPAHGCLACLSFASCTLALPMNLDQACHAIVTRARTVGHHLHPLEALPSNGHLRVPTALRCGRVAPRPRRCAAAPGRSYREHQETWAAQRPSPGRRAETHCGGHGYPDPKRVAAVFATAANRRRPRRSVAAAARAGARFASGEHPP